MKTILALLICSMPAFAQIGAIREETKTTNPDGSVTFTRKFDPPVQQAAPVYAEPVTIYRTVTTYRSAPTLVTSSVVYAVPVSAKTPVAQYRTGLFGLRRNVVHADGSTTQYGPLGRKR